MNHCFIQAKTFCTSLYSDKSEILIVFFNCEWLIDRIVPLAMDRAIREIITPVVERSVTIACMTTRELVLKVCGFFSVLL